MEPWSLGDQTGKYQRINKDECGSLWFTRFIKGMKARMGQTWLPNKTLSTELLMELTRLVEIKIATNEDDFVEQH